MLQGVVQQVQLLKTLKLLNARRKSRDLVVRDVHLSQLVKEADGGGKVREVVEGDIELS